MKEIYNIIVIVISSIFKAVGTLAVAAETEASSAFPEAAQKLEAELAKAAKPKKLP